jgi:hypothetical protein
LRKNVRSVISPIGHSKSRISFLRFVILSVRSDIFPQLVSFDKNLTFRKPMLDVVCRGSVGAIIIMLFAPAIILNASITTFPFTLCTGSTTTATYRMYIYICMYIYVYVYIYIEVYNIYMTLCTGSTTTATYRMYIYIYMYAYIYIYIEVYNIYI